MDRVRVVPSGWMTTTLFSPVGEMSTYACQCPSADSAVADVTATGAVTRTNTTQVMKRALCGLELNLAELELKSRLGWIGDFGNRPNEVTGSTSVDGEPWILLRFAYCSR